MRKAIVLLVIAPLFVGTASAQSTSMMQPPANAHKLSEIIAKIEARDKFQYVSEIEWSRDGYYEVSYYTTDKAKVEMHIDPVSGEAK